jgi:hypothetical protein
MIIVDNSVEYMLKAYGDNVVAQKGQIPKTEWQKMKRDFRQVLDFVATNSNFSEKPDDVFHYHDKLRNPLYHDAAPLSVEPRKITEYMDKAKVILKDLFGIRLTEKEWDNRIKKTMLALTGKAKPKLVELFKTDDGLAKMQTNIKLKDTEAILLMIYGFGMINGRPPTSIEELGKCLHYSGHPIKQERLSVNISHLRSAKRINRGELTLTTKACEKIKTKYIVPE